MENQTNNPQLDNVLAALKDKAEDIEKFRKWCADTSGMESKKAYESAVKTFGESRITPGAYRCACCKKNNVSNLDLFTFNTRFIKQPNCVVAFLCPDCVKQFFKEKLAIIVCLKCKEVIGFWRPTKDKKTGFETKPLTAYHMEDCPKCNYAKYEKNQGPFFLLEEQIYNNKQLKKGK